MGVGSGALNPLTHNMVPGFCITIAQATKLDRKRVLVSICALHNAFYNLYHSSKLL